MLYYALLFLVIALVAGVLCFGSVAGGAALIGQATLLLFLALVVVSLIVGTLRRA